MDFIRNRIILETQAEHLLACLKAGTVSTNDRQINSQFYERTALSKNKTAMLVKGEKPKPGRSATPAAEPQTEARHSCGSLQMPARDERAVCEAERASSRGAKGRPGARGA